MRGWFDRLPIHRKLVASALLITFVALVIATAGLGAFDLWRHRATAKDDATALAQVVLSLTFLAFHAWTTGHAIVLTLVRLAFTKSRLLEWETAAATARPTPVNRPRRANISRQRRSRLSGPR